MEIPFMDVWQGSKYTPGIRPSFLKSYLSFAKSIVQLAFVKIKVLVPANLSQGRNIAEYFYTKHRAF